MTVPRQSVGDRAELARRLRDLRLHQWPGQSVTQRMLAEALGESKPLSLSLISAWENENNPTAPRPAQLRAYATFFATERSLASGRAHVLPDEDLTADEIAVRDQLYDSLLGLRRQLTAEPPASSADAPIRFDWRIPPGEPVRIVCGKLKDPKHPYMDPDDVNYTDLLTFADVDALVELFGHLRKVNPDSDVRFIRADRLNPAGAADDLASHLVLIGGIALNDVTTSILDQAALPIRQVEHPDLNGRGEIFEVTEGKEASQFLPMLAGDRVVEDVGLLARMPNPNNSSTTLTFCSGVFARGVLGAVRALTDDKLREQNESYLAQRFAGAERFAILLRVPVLLGTALTPDLRNPSTRLFEWCDEAARGPRTA
jgi:hypothetical protein